MALANVPSVLKHMTLAIMDKKTGHNVRGFLEAFEIAKANLVDNGNLAAAAKHKKARPEDIRLTSDGHRLESRHRKCPRARSKDRQFDAWWAKIEVAVSEKSPGKASDGAVTDDADSSQKAAQRGTQAMKSKAG